MPNDDIIHIPESGTAIKLTIDGFEVPSAAYKVEHLVKGMYTVKLTEAVTLPDGRMFVPEVGFADVETNIPDFPIRRHEGADIFDELGARLGHVPIDEMIPLARKHLKDVRS